MEKTAPYMRRNKMKIGDVIAITRRPDARLGVEHNSEAALSAVSQGRGRSAGCANMSAAETIAAQRCLRNPACSKTLGHAGFCDNGKSGSAVWHNSLARLAAAAEQASNRSSTGYGLGQARTGVHTLAADRSASSQQPQGMLVGKVLSRADVEHCRVVLPRMAMEANLPEVVEAGILDVDLLDEDNTAWPVTLSMSSYGVAKRMFILEKIGAYMRQHRLQPGDCIAIKRTYNDLLRVVINPDAPPSEVPAVSSKDSETVPANGLVSDSADSMDVSRRQSVRRRRFKTGCEVNFARMLCGSLKSNGLADPFKNNEDDTFPEEQLPPPLQEHATASVDHPPRKGRQSGKAPAAGFAHAVYPALYQQQHAAQMQQPSASQQLHLPSYIDMWPTHAAAISQAFGANMGFGANGSISSLYQNAGAAAGANAAAAAFAANMSAYQASGLPLPQTMPAALNAKAAPSADAVTNPSLPPHASPVPHCEPATAPVPAVSASQHATPASEAQQPPVVPATSVLPQTSAAVGVTATMHPPMQYPTPPGSLPPLLHPSLAPPAVQATASTAAPPMSGFPGSFPFPPNTSAADAFNPAMHCSTAADMARLTQSQLGWYAQHLPPFGGAHPPGLNGFLPTPFALNTDQARPKAEDTSAVASAAAGVPGLSTAAVGTAGEAGRKRKASGAAQRKGSRAGGAPGDAGGPVIARRAANRPPPQVPHGSLGKGSGTPKNLARSHVLVAKVLTNSDAHGRIILPRVSVEANLTFLMGYRQVTATDRTGRKWEFVIKSWANGTENRRVYVLEQTGEFLKVHRLGVGDAVGICTNDQGDLVVEANSGEVRQATVRPTYGATAVPHMPAPPPGKAESFSSGAPGRCSRSPCCTKFAGHSGFCSGPRALNDVAGAARLRQEEPEDTTDQLQRRPSAAAAQEEAEDLSEAQEVDSKEVAVGTLVITHLTQQDLRAKEILLPKQAVEANILPALTYSLLKFKVVDDKGKQHEVLLRSFVHGHGETMYLLDRLAPLLHSANAQPGDMLMLSRDEDGPVKVHLESMNYSHQPAGAMLHSRHATPSRSRSRADSQDYTEGKAELGDVLVCTRTSGCTKAAGHQGFCSGHKGFRRRFFEGAAAQASGEWSDVESGSDCGQDDGSSYGRTPAPTSHIPRNVAGKRKGHSQAVPAKRMAMTQEVPVTCGCSSGVYDIRRGCISLRAAQHGQFVNLEFSPGEFEEHVLGCKQDWRQSLLVEVGQQSQNGLQQALPLGPWLHQQGISVDDEGRMLSSAQPSRFAQEAALEAQPSLSGPPAHCPARVSKAGRPPHPMDRAHSLPTRVKPASHTHLARFASKPVPRAYVPKKARSRAAGRAEPVTSQDSLAAEVLLSLCPSGYREIGCDMGDGAVESAAPERMEAEQEQAEGQLTVPAAEDEQKGFMQTERTLSIPLVDARGHGGMATMDPARSAVLDHLFSAGGHL
ncbi:hypothetical protein ABBQ38_001346 [Trebouxia sp. C0009 RCD-2024]